MAGAVSRIGWIVPSSNTVMEVDFHRQLAGSIVSTTRILLEQVTREAELRMLDEDLPRRGADQDDRTGHGGVWLQVSRSA